MYAVVSNTFQENYAGRLHAATLYSLYKGNLVTTMHHKDQISRDQNSVCHCNSTLYHNNSNICAIRTRKSRAEAVVTRRVYCTYKFLAPVMTDLGNAREARQDQTRYAHIHCLRRTALADCMLIHRLRWPQ